MLHHGSQLQMTEGEKGKDTVQRRGHTSGPHQAKRTKCYWSIDVLAQLRDFSKALKAEVTMQSHVKTL